MTPEQSPLDAIVSLGERRATGVLVCASDAVEVHVYFHRGRIAWATDGTRPAAFTRRLKETAQIDAAALREVLESCRRERRGLGETLISWGLASRAAVLAAIRHQIETSLQPLRGIEGIPSLFLNRSAQFEAHDAALTFSVGELLDAAVLAKTGRAAAPAPSLPNQLASLVDGLAWVEALDETALVAAIPRGGAATRVPASLVEGMLLDGAELVAVCTSQATLAGVAQPDRGSLWCQAPTAVTVGTIVAALESLAPARQSGSSPALGLAPSPRPRWIFGGGDAGVMQTLAAFVEQARDVVAVFVTSDAGAQYGAGRAGDPEALAALIGRRAAALAAAGGCGDTSPVALWSRLVMSAERDVCLFSAELESAASPRSVWVVLERSCSKGLGWGHATWLRRELLQPAEASGGARRGADRPLLRRVK